jgi:hypothetical protein
LHKRAERGVPPNAPGPAAIAHIPLLPNALVDHPIEEEGGRVISGIRQGSAVEQVASASLAEETFTARNGLGVEPVGQVENEAHVHTRDLSS